MLQRYLRPGERLLWSGRKQRTCYGITDQRALVAVGPGQLSDSPLRNQPVSVRRSRDGQHATVIIGDAAGQRRTGDRYSASASLYYANTGMELLSRHTVLPVAFYDVTDPDSMLTALDDARAPNPTD